LQQDARQLQIKLPENYKSYTDIIRDAHLQSRPEKEEEIFEKPESEYDIICNSLQIE